MRLGSDSARRHPEGRRGPFGSAGAGPGVLPRMARRHLEGTGIFAPNPLSYVSVGMAAFFMTEIQGGPWPLCAASHWKTQFLSSKTSTTVTGPSRRVPWCPGRCRRRCRSIATATRSPRRFTVCWSTRLPLAPAQWPRRDEKISLLPPPHLQWRADRPGGKVGGPLR